MKPLEAFELPLGGVQLIEANAGTGKTYTITTLCLRLLLERRLDISQILVVTYTNAATAELRRKVRERIHAALAALRGEPVARDATLIELERRRRALGDVAGDCRRLEAALYGFDEAAIFTIHGFCQRVLQEHAFESAVPFDVELLGDDRILLDEAVRDFWSRELYAAPEDVVAFLHGKKYTPARLMQLARLVVIHPELRVVPDDTTAAADETEPADTRWLRMQRGLAASLPAELRRRKHAAQVQSFDDLLQRVADALRGAGASALVQAIRRRYPAALIDEFQDTDPVQYRIFDAIHGSGDGALFLIGDPKQAIYGFRGADVFAYVGAKSRCGDDAYTLGVNRRSGPALVRAVNSVFGRAAEPFVLSGIPFFRSSAAPEARDRLAGALAGRAPLRILFVRRSEDSKWINVSQDGLGWLYAAVAAEIARLLEADSRLDDQRVVAGDIAVLCRTNDQTTQMQEALAGLGVRSVLQGDASVFDTAECTQVERVVRALADPSDTAAMTAALLTPLIGLSGDTLAAARSDERQWEQWIDRFQVWHDVWQRSGFTAAFRRLLDECTAPARILASAGGERSLTNVLHLGELLQTASAQTRRGPLALVEWLQRMRSDELARLQEAAESAQIRLESDSHALKLVTVHKSKGLQYPIVVCPFLWSGAQRHPFDDYPCFHDGAADDRLTVDLIRSERRDQAVARERMAERLRLAYVALTRAEQLCLVVWGAFRNCATSPLGYLLHQPSGSAADVGRETQRRLDALSDDAMRADLDRFVAESEGAIEVVDLPRMTGNPLPSQRTIDAPMTLRTASRSLVQCWRLASFSALAAADRALPEPAEEGIDRDELADDGSSASIGDGGTVRAFPRGRRLGTLVHRLFETADFVSATRDTLRAEAAGLLPAYGIEPHWADALADTVCDVLDTALTADGAPVRLRDVGRERRLTELEFVFPVALAADESSLGTFTAERLAAVYRAYGRSWMADEYADRLRRLPFAPLSGYLKGYIDLVFAAHGRWYVADYKTNDLGPRAADYGPERLVREMQRHHYLLQAHLYAVAVHRYLRRRVPDYVYERDFGGVLYLFVRGMAPTQAPGCGVFFDRPDQALIEALSAALAEAVGSR